MRGLPTPSWVRDHISYLMGIAVFLLALFYIGLGLTNRGWNSALYFGIAILFGWNTRLFFRIAKRPPAMTSVLRTDRVKTVNVLLMNEQALEVQVEQYHSTRVIAGTDDNGRVLNVVIFPSDAPVP